MTELYVMQIEPQSQCALQQQNNIQATQNGAKNKSSSMEFLGRLGLS